MDTMINKKYGHWTVLKFSHIGTCRDKYYLCECDCGTKKAVRGNSLRTGKATQCQACAARLTKNRTTHGLCGSPIYNTWKMMMARCDSPNSTAFNSYGKRGIKVCNEWRDGATFIDWAINNGWAADLSIDRIDVNGDYSPENCRWATNKQQKENVRLLVASNKSGYRGVSHKPDRDVWLSRLTVDYKKIHLGHHKTPELAAKAYDNYIISNGLKRPLNFEIEARGDK
ncbi:MAG: AP2 domain-containing protein [Desulfuromonadaceae bacterium]